MRRTYKLRNGADGDVYSCILHAVASDPPALSFRYEDLMQRIARICDGDAPKGSSVIGSCQQMHRIAAKQAVNQRALEWDDGRKVLDIPDPYLVFYLRWSNYLVNHADEPVSATLATITEMRDARAGKRTSLSSADAKLLDELALEKLIRLGAAQGYVTYDDFNEAMPEFLGSNEDIDRWLLALNKAGIDVRPDAEKET